MLSAASRALAAFDSFSKWLATDAPSAGEARYAAGSAFIDLLIARGHWCSTDRRVLASAARNALEETSAVLDQRAKAAAPGGWPEVQERLAAAHPTAARYLDAFQQTWDDCRSRAIEARLVSWPEYPIRYVPIPAQTRDAAPFLYYLSYRSPAPFDRLPTHDYVVSPIDEDLSSDEQVRRLRAANTSVIKLNHVVHHGAIGQHVQNYYAYAGNAEIGRVAAVDCASRIGCSLAGRGGRLGLLRRTDGQIGFLFTRRIAAQPPRVVWLRAVVDLAARGDRFR